MVLVDTSVWVSHFRSGDDRFAALLQEGKVLSHPFVIGELSCGNLKNRRGILSLLRELPEAEAVTHDEALFFIEEHGLMDRGLGFVDVQLLAAARLTGVPLWTYDRRLREAAAGLHLEFQCERSGE